MIVRVRYNNSGDRFEDVMNVESRELLRDGREAGWIQSILGN